MNVGTLRFDTTFILIDNSDPAIEYAGPWQEASVVSLGLGPTPFDTLHVLSHVNGSLSYNFTGIGIAVFVSTLGSNQNNIAQCILNGVSVPLSRGPNTSTNVRLCGKSRLPDGVLHNLAVIVTPEDETPGFVLDHIRVTPSSSISTEGKIIMLSLDYISPSSAHPNDSEWNITSTGLQDAFATGSWAFVPSNDFEDG
ncbi:hypothetical protein D9619_007611 [Psilocybe cf. subviscida]|uniref:Uncharacterized protein n=1 Tax=Psilocybe cf. subviscida TaxID=2480587 RepID=A0A8H5B1G0_9AGAR|nr:hypothetical protein D9619_007611 [Psilocybe cf. subviscida]